MDMRVWLVATTKYPTPHTRDTHAPNNQKTAQVSMLELQVPGLLERRPAVVYGDCIRFRFTAFLQSVLRVREREKEREREREERERERDYVCLYVCVCMCVHVCVYVCTCVECARTRAYACGCE